MSNLAGSHVLPEKRRCPSFAMLYWSIATRTGRDNCVKRIKPHSGCEEQFEIYIYNNASREDDKTEVFKTLVPGPSELAVCQAIAETSHERES